MKPDFEFRASYKYSNVMYGLMSHVADVLGEDTWENLITVSL